MKIVSNLIYSVFVLLLLSIAGLFLATLLPIPGNIEVKIVKSGSMEPAIHTGSVVIVKPETTYKVGDVVTFGEDTKKQIPTTHRIVSMRDENGVSYIATKGDANEEPDSGETPVSEIIGKVLFSIPSAGYVLDFARRPLGFALLIGLPATLIVIDESMRIVREVASMREKKRMAYESAQSERIRPRV